MTGHVQAYDHALAASGAVDDASDFLSKKFGSPAEVVGHGLELSEDAKQKLKDISASVTCESYLPAFVCEGRTPGIGDVPWWIWAFLATGVVGFGALSYVSYKAAPYVLPIAIPESAPFAMAWQQARSSEEKQKVAQDALAALVQARRTSSKDFGLTPQEQAVKHALAVFEARQELAGRELRSMVPVRG